MTSSRERTQEGCYNDPQPTHKKLGWTLLELGYAIKTKGWTRIIIVFNDAYGRVEDLPFDVRGKNVLKYSAADDEQERASERRKLAGRLEMHFRLILLEERPQADPIAHVTKLIDAKQYGGLKAFVKKQADPVIAELTAERFNTSEKGEAGEFASRIHDYERICLPLTKLLATGCSADPHPEVWLNLVDRIGNAYESSLPDGYDWWRELRAYPGILAFSAVGVTYVAEKRYDLLARLLKETAYHEFSPTRSHERATNRLPLAKYLYVEQFKQQKRWGEELKADPRTGMSDHVAEQLAVALDDLIPQRNKFDFSFDKFEFLTCLHLFATNTDDYGLRAPYGAFLRTRRFHASMGKELEKEVAEGGNDNSPIVKARIAGNDTADFVRFVAQYEKWLNENTKSMMFFS